MSIGTIDQILTEMGKGIYDYTQDGKCSSCGSCCSNLLPLSQKEFVRIRDYVQRKHIQECVNRPPTMAPVQDWTCPFRDNMRKVCTIYEVRPAICRDFQCDKPKKQIEADREMYNGRYVPVNMRETFFPKGGE